MKSIITRNVLIVLVSVLIGIPSAVWSACSGSGLTYTCTAGSTIAQVQAAYNSASDGATITFAAGSYSWSTAIQLDMTKGVTLMGATNHTSIVNAGGTFFGGNTSYAFGTANRKIYRVSGFTINGGNPAIWIFGTGNMYGLRIDNNIFNNSSGAQVILLGEGSSQGDYYGVIDNNKFLGSQNYQAVELYGKGLVNPWRSSPKGQEENLFFEDNTINFSSMPSPDRACFDTSSSASYVFRHNTITNCLTEGHSWTSNGGTILIEYYENDTTITDTSWNGANQFHHLESGEVIVFNNLFSYSGGAVNGSVIWLGEQACGSYPCLMQYGRMTGGALSPVYGWNNRWKGSGTKIDLAVGSNHNQQNRDWYTAVSANAQTSSTTPFNGTTGVGFGTLANRPSTCTTGAELGGGVGYFATDVGEQGVLYRCSATNSWTVHYAPYTYPHPLRQGDAEVKAPAGLKIIQ
jgi:hypothetical protein